MMERVSDPSDEFSFLPAQSAEAGIPGPLPHGERVRLELADGRTCDHVPTTWFDPLSHMLPS